MLADLPDASVDAVVADPPYSSGGMVRSDRANIGTVTKYTTNQNTKRADLIDFGGDNRDKRALPMGPA